MGLTNSTQLTRYPFYVTKQTTQSFTTIEKGQQKLSCNSVFRKSHFCTSLPFPTTQIKKKKNIINNALLINIRNFEQLYNIFFKQKNFFANSHFFVVLSRRAISYCYFRTNRLSSSFIRHHNLFQFFLHKHSQHFTETIQLLNLKQLPSQFAIKSTQKQKTTVNSRYNIPLI